MASEHKPRAGLRLRLRLSGEHRASRSFRRHLLSRGGTHYRYRRTVQNYQLVLGRPEVPARQGARVSRETSRANQGTVGPDYTARSITGNVDVWSGALGSTPQRSEPNSDEARTTRGTLVPWRRVLRILSGWREPAAPVDDLEESVQKNAERIDYTRQHLARLDRRVELFDAMNRQRDAEEQQ
jgi:hypothetical protein